MLKFFRTLFSKSKAVDTLTILPQWLRNGNTLEEATQLISKATVPVKQQVADVPMVRVVQERVMTTGNPKRQYRYFTTVLMPNVSNKPVKL